MKKLFLLKLLLSISTVGLYAHQTSPGFSIYISDNKNNQNQAFNYSITCDSLIITGLSDYGKSSVEYLRRPLSPEEKKNLNTFMKTFYIDKFNDLYFKDYSNLAYISPDHYPRVIDLEINNQGKSKKIKINNMFVPAFAGLFQIINPFLPEEVKINYLAHDFEKEPR